MDEQAITSIVRIYRRQDLHVWPVGCGFLTSGRTILTCRHVINEALSPEMNLSEKEVEIDFPFPHNSGLLKAKVILAVDQPDIAKLELLCDPPKAISAMPLGIDIDLQDHPYSAFGVTSDRPEGYWSSGTIKSIIADGTMQFEGNSAYRVEQGFSGTALWDDKIEKTVGMVVITESDQRLGAAYAIPLASLLEICPELKNLAARNAARNVPFQAPSLPEHLVSRSETKKILKSRLLGRDHRPGTVIATAIYGMGGCGKTFMAIDLANDEDVKNYFINGILWTTLGQEPNILSTLNEWIESLSIELKPATTINDGYKKLKNLIKERNLRLLIIIDDVWEEEHVKPLLIAGFPCHNLITTRRPDVASDCGASLFELGMMNPEESLQLFSSWLEYEQDDAEKNEALIVAKDVGYLALALKLVAARIKAGATWKEIHQSLEQEMSHLEKLESPRHRKSGEMKLQASLNLSLKALRSYDQEALTYFFWLGVLPDDARINSKMAANLWGICEEKADEVLELLWSEALIFRDKTSNSIDKEIKIYYLHDLLHDHARAFLIKASHPGSSDIPGLELELAKANRLFLEKYRCKLKDNLWQNLNDDGYIFSHLTWHMQRADMAEDIHNLMREETSSGKNGWYIKLESNGQMAIFMEDIFRAWRLSEAESNAWIERGERAPTIAMEIRYALMASSIRSLTASIPPKLLLLLVQIGIWTPLQGLAYARQNPNSHDRCDILARLAGYFGPEKGAILKEAHKEASMIRDGLKRILTLASIAPFFPEEKVIIDEAFSLNSRIIENDFEKSIALAKIAPLLSDPQKGFSAAKMIQNHNQRDRILAEIIPRFADPKEAFSRAMEIQDEDLRYSILFKIVSRFSNANEALSRVMTIKKSGHRYKLFGVIAKNLADPEEAVSIAFKINDDLLRASVLSTILPRFTDAKKILQEAMSLEDDYQRAKALTEIAPIIADANDAIHAASGISIKYPYLKAIFLTKISRLLEDPGEALREALDVSKEIRSASLKAEVLAEIAGLAANPENILKDALAATDSIKDSYTRAKSLAKISPRFANSKPILIAAFKAAKETGSALLKAEILARISQDLDDSEYVLYEALEVAEVWYFDQIAEILSKIGSNVTEEVFLKAIARYSDRSDLIKKIFLMHHHPWEDLGQLLSVLRGIKDEYCRTNALIYIASKLSNSRMIANEALSAANGIKRDADRDYAFSRIVSLLSDPKEALSVAMRVQDCRIRSRVLTQVSSRFPDHPEISIEAASSALLIEDRDQQLEAFCEIVPYHPDPMKILSATMKINDEDERKEAHAEFSSRLHDNRNIYCSAEATTENRNDSLIPAQIKTRFENLQDAMDSISKINDSYQKAIFLARIASAHPDSPSILENALLVASNIEDYHRKAMALAEIASKVNDPQKVIQDSLSSAINIESNDLRRKTILKIEPIFRQLSIGSMYQVWNHLIHILGNRSRKKLLPVLADLIPLIVIIGDKNVLEHTALAINDVGRWWGSSSPHQDDEKRKNADDFRYANLFDGTYSVDGGVGGG